MTSESPVPTKGGRLELIIVILLGLVSVTTAYASFQAAIYDSAMASSYARAQTTSTEAESLYQEASQIARQNENVWNRLVDLQIEMESGDPDVAAMAAYKWEQLYFTSVSDELEAAMDWSNAQNAANPEEYISPLESEEYTSTLYADYEAAAESAEESIAEGDEYNASSDRLTLNTVLMAISLFLLGIAAVLTRRGLVIALISIAGVIYGVALVLTLTIPMMWV
jgi:hypothetical protein